ncbi:hypothetical protein [Radiobacillus sp. PE A8.2]|uniref:hypothetical protein n=1 Tax=Radiobacillus sp. PE A8.2 TaxID=3380349 RepID=UPI003890B248
MKYIIKSRLENFIVKSSNVQNISHNTSDHANSVSAATEEQACVMGEFAQAAESLAEMAKSLQNQIKQFSQSKQQGVHLLI